MDTFLDDEGVGTGWMVLYYNFFYLENDAVIDEDDNGWSFQIYYNQQAI